MKFETDNISKLTVFAVSVFVETPEVKKVSPVTVPPLKGRYSPLTPVVPVKLTPKFG